MFKQMLSARSPKDRGLAAPGAGGVLFFFLDLHEFPMDQFWGGGGGGKSVPGFPVKIVGPPFMKERGTTRGYRLFCFYYTFTSLSSFDSPVPGPSDCCLPMFTYRPIKFCP